MDRLRRHESESHSLLPLAQAFFAEYNYGSFAIRSFDQALESISRVTSKQNIVSVTRITERGETIKIEAWLDNIVFKRPLDLETDGMSYPSLPTIAMRDEGTYTNSMVADFHARITLLESTAEQESILLDEMRSLTGKQVTNRERQVEAHEIKLRREFKARLPIPVGSKYCTTSTMEQWSLFLSGEDPEDLQGYFIRNGTSQLVGSVYSHFFNFPTAVKADKDGQVARTNILFRKDVFYGNSYYITPLILKDKRSVVVGSRNKSMQIFDIVVAIHTAHEDSNSTKSFPKANRIPIRALFFMYGCTTDRKIVDFIFPGPFQTVENVNFLQNSFAFGTSHDKLPVAMTKSDAELFAAEELMLPERKRQYKEKAEEDATRFQELTRMSIEEFTELIYRSRMIRWVRKIMKVFFMPNVNDDPKKVCIQLGQLIAQLIYVHTGQQEETDRTSLENRVIHLLGEQYIYEFKTQYSASVVRPMRKFIFERMKGSSFNALKIGFSEAIKHRLAGWGNSLFRKMTEAFKNTQRPGQPRLLGEEYEAKSRIFLMSKIRECVIRPNAGDRQDRIVYDQRRNHPSYATILDPWQTPEAGKGVGRYHQPTLYTVVSIVIDPTIIEDIILAYPVFTTEVPEHNRVSDVYYVYLNWTLIGSVPRGQPAHDMWLFLMNERRTNDDVDFEIGISIDHYQQRLIVNTVSGRPSVPFIRADAIDKPAFRTLLQQMNAGVAKWIDGLKSGFIEYIDPNMMSNAVIAFDLEDFRARGRECTHIMMPCGIMGLIPSLNPAMDRNRSVRGLLATNHVKQAMGWVMHNVMTRNLKEINILESPERPLVYTAMYEILGLWKYAYGQSAIIAFMPFAMNQEDALVFNQGAIDRASFLVHHVIMHKSQIDGNTAYFGRRQHSSLYRPIAKERAYRKVNPDKGIPMTIGSLIYTGDVITAKYRKLRTEELESIQMSGRNINAEVKDESEVYKHPDLLRARHPMPARVVASDPGSIGNSQRRSVKFSVSRRPVHGDKFSSRHGQKGTIGAIIPEEDMPYTEDGIRPTIIFNSFALLKRETYGHEFDALLGKVCALFGTRLESTPFMSNLDAGDYADLLERMGLNRRGLETLYNGITGDQYEAPVFIGVEYYVRQRHMVVDKSYLRSGGARDGYSRQATHGKDKQGGLKISEMESDAISTAGAAGVLRDCLHSRSAPTITHICSSCGLLAYPSLINRNMTHCDACGELPSNINHRLKVPYNVRLVTNTLGGASISFKTILEPPRRAKITE